MSACYNSRAFASMGYVHVDSGWVRKKPKNVKRVFDHGGPSKPVSPSVPHVPSQKFEKDLKDLTELLLSLHLKGDKAADELNKIKLDVGKFSLKLDGAVLTLLLLLKRFMQGLIESRLRFTLRSMPWPWTFKPSLTG